MTRKYNMIFVLGLVYVAYFVGGMMMIVGKVSECSIEPNGWDMPLKAFLLLGTPFLLGYVAGKNDN